MISKSTQTTDECRNEGESKKENPRTMKYSILLLCCVTETSSRTEELTFDIKIYIIDCPKK